MGVESGRDGGELKWKKGAGVELDLDKDLGEQTRIVMGGRWHGLKVGLVGDLNLEDELGSHWPRLLMVSCSSEKEKPGPTLGTGWSGRR